MWDFCSSCFSCEMLPWAMMRSSVAARGTACSWPTGLQWHSGKWGRNTVQECSAHLGARAAEEDLLLWLCSILCVMLSSHAVHRHS